MEFYDTKGFGEKLRQIREDRKLTREDVQLGSGISKRALINLEQGKSIPKLETIHLLSLILNADILTILSSFMITGSSDFITKSNEINNKINYQDYSDTLIELFHYHTFKEDDLTKAQHLTKDALSKELLLIKLHTIYFKGLSIKDSSLEMKINKTLDDYSYDFNSVVNFGYIDIKVGLILADHARRNNNFDNAKVILDKVNNELKEYSMPKEAYLELRIMILASYSVYYNRLSDYRMIVKVCADALEQISKSKNNKYTYIFLYRMSTALYQLNNVEYKKYINMFICMLYSQNDLSTLKNLLSMLKKQYSGIYDYVINNTFFRSIISDLQ